MVYVGATGRSMPVGREKDCTRMAEMSPIAGMVLKILKNGAAAAAVLLVLFSAIALWQRLTPDGSLKLQEQDYGFFGVVSILLLLALWLIRAIGREIDSPGG